MGQGILQEPLPFQEWILSPPLPWHSCLLHTVTYCASSDTMFSLCEVSQNSSSLLLSAAGRRGHAPHVTHTNSTDVSFLLPKKPKAHFFFSPQQHMRDEPAVREIPFSASCPASRLNKTAYCHIVPGMPGEERRGLTFAVSSRFLCGRQGSIRHNGFVTARFRQGSSVEYSAGLQASDFVAARILVFQEALDKGHKQFAHSSY